jgi:hypothetical protein
MLIYTLGLILMIALILSQFCCKEGTAVSLELDLLFWLLWHLLATPVSLLIFGSKDC